MQRLHDENTLQERTENTGKRRGVSSNSDWKRKRPIGLGEYQPFIKFEMLTLIFSC